MPFLFSYGSLQEPAVQLATLGRHPTGERDVLPGHTIVTVFSNGRACANAVPADAARCIAGTAFEITDAELALADDYEAADGYGRSEVTLRSGRRAWMYACAARPASLVTVRPARADDVATLARIWHEGWHDAHDSIVPERLAALRTAGTFLDRLPAELPNVLTVTDGETNVGFAMLRADEVFQFYVDRAARGTGAAAILMRATEERLAGNGLTDVWLACAVGNVRAARFYEKCGWSRTATETINSETSKGRFPIEVWRYEKRLR